MADQLTTTTRPVGLVINPSPMLRTRRAIHDTNSVLWRDSIRTLRQPDMLAFAVVMGVFFLVLFNYVFGGSIGAGMRTSIWSTRRAASTVVPAMVSARKRVGSMPLLGAFCN